MTFRTWFNGLNQKARLKAFYDTYERLLVPGFLLSGFLLHLFTFRTLEVQTTFIGLGVYALMAAVCIMYIYVYDVHGVNWRHPFWSRFRLAAPLLTQLALGSLLSMSLLFYWFSGALSTSWPIFLTLIALIIFNEAFRHAYARPILQMAVFCFVLFSYFSQLFAYLFSSLEAWTFILGGIVSLVVSLLMILLLEHLVPRSQLRLKRMAAAVCGVFIVMNALYAFDLIPPVPLSLLEAGIYHDVRRAGDNYVLLGEQTMFLEELLLGPVLHQDTTGRVFAYTVIYSPSSLSTDIYHVWEHYDPVQKRWIVMSRSSFPIKGGRTEGYRGYTYHEDLVPGKWRVDVETSSGQVLGRIPFTYVAME